MKYKDVVGQKFGDWIVENTTDSFQFVVCRCTRCGKIKTIDKYSLINGRSTKCRACSASLQKATKWTGNPVRYIYAGMWQRCYDKNHKQYAYYGANGITICDEWLNDRTKFYVWAVEHGYQKGMSVERIDTSLGYSPNNCKIIPKNEQSKNRATTLWVIYNGDRMCLTDACRKAGIVFGSVQMYRSRNHCSPQEAFDHFIVGANR